MSGLLAGILLKATVILGAALVADRLLRRASAAVRHLSWAVAVVAVLFLPLSTIVTPPMSVSVPAVPAVSSLVGGAAGASVSGAPSAELAAAVEPAGPLPAGKARVNSAVGTAPVAGVVPRSSGNRQASVLALTWGIGAGFVLAWLGLSWLWAWRLGRRAGHFESERVRRMVRRLAARLGIRSPPPLLRGAVSDVPSTLGILRSRILLPAGADRWNPARLEAVLAHELAHVRRRDCAVQAMAGLACALYWFHPLAWVAARRLATEREFACDDEVLRLGARPSAYGECLVDLARSFTHPRLSAAVVTQIVRPGGLSERVAAVLAEGVDRRRISRAGVLVTAALAALVLVPLSAARAVAPSGAQPQDTEARIVGDAVDPSECWTAGVSRSLNVHRDERGWEARWESDRCTSEIEVRPEIRFTSDFSWIASLGPDAIVRVDETNDGVHRRVEFRPGAGAAADGEPVLRFWLDGRLADVDADARQWIEHRLLTVLRLTGLQAEERVGQILSADGVDGVLGEAGEISADHAQARYLSLLLERARLDDGELIRTLETAERGVGSDASLARVLATAARLHRDRVVGVARAAFLGAARKVGSDGTHSRMLQEVVDDARGEDLSTRAAVAALALESARAEVGSDGVMANFLIRIAGSHREILGEPSVRERFLSALATVGSDRQEERVRRAVGGTLAGES